MLGIDLLATERVSKLYKREWYAAFWMNPDERSHVESKPNSIESAAAVIAAKEAVMKASGRGFQQGILPREITVDWSSHGAPSAELDGTHYFLSLSHSDGLAIAVAITSEDTQ